MLQKPSKTNMFLVLLILCSTLWWSVHLWGIPFYWVNAVYIGLIAPYLIWRLLFPNGKNTFWRTALMVVPLLLIAATLLFFDLFVIPMSIFEGFPMWIYERPQTLIVMVLNPYQFFIRIILYGLMILIWDNRIVRARWVKALLWIGTVLYLLCVGILIFVGMTVSEMYAF